METVATIIIAFLMTFLTIWCQTKLFGTNIKEYLTFMLSTPLDIAYQIVIMVVMFFLYMIIVMASCTTLFHSCGF